MKLETFLRVIWPVMLIGSVLGGFLVGREVYYWMAGFPTESVIAVSAIAGVLTFLALGWVSCFLSAILDEVFGV